MNARLTMEAVPTIVLTSLVLTDAAAPMAWVLTSTTETALVSISDAGIWLWIRQGIFYRTLLAYFHVHSPERFCVTTGQLQNQGYFQVVYYNTAGHRFY